MKEQIPLTIQFDEILNFANFLNGRNQQAIDHLKSLQTQYGQAIFLHGVTGCGKTHLAQATFHSYNEHGLVAGYIDAKEGGIAPIMLDGLDNYDCLIIDGIEAIIADRDWQEAVFHCFNRFIQRGANLLFTSTKSPAELNDILPDLSSRLLSGLVFQLKELSDDEKLAALQARAKEFGMELSKEVGQFWLTHGSRENSMLFPQLRQLDQASLTHKRKLTIPFLKQELEL